MNDNFGSVDEILKQFDQAIFGNGMDAHKIGFLVGSAISHATDYVNEEGSIELALLESRRLSAHMLEFSSWNFTTGFVAGLKVHQTVHCQCETDVDEAF